MGGYEGGVGCSCFGRRLGGEILDEASEGGNGQEGEGFLNVFRRCSLRN